MIPRISSGARIAGATVLVAAAAAILYGCAGAPANDDSASLEARTIAMLKESFKAHGQAGLDRLDQDDTQRVCSRYSTTPPPRPWRRRSRPRTSPRSAIPPTAS
jgi:hypothetical protein